MPQALRKATSARPAELGFSHAGALALELTRAVAKAMSDNTPGGAGSRISKSLESLEANRIQKAGVLAELLYGPAKRLALSMKRAGQAELAKDLDAAAEELPKLFKIGKARRDRTEKATLDTSDWSSPRLILDGDIVSVDIDTDTADLLMCSIWCVRTLVGIFPDYPGFKALSVELTTLRPRWNEQDAKRSASELLGLIARIEPVLRDKAPELAALFLGAKVEAEHVAANGLAAMATPAATEEIGEEKPAAEPVAARAPVDKRVLPVVLGIDTKAHLELAKLPARVKKALALTCQIVAVDLEKDAQGKEQRIALGPVLVPDVADLQGDVINAAEIEKTADAYMEFYRNRGLQHSELVNDKVAILQSWTSPVDFKIGERLIKAGTWLMKVRYYDDEMWEKVKKGELTGFSIGGTGVRVPIDN